MADYSAVNKDGSLATVAGANGEAALTAAGQLPNVDPHSGVITPTIPSTTPAPSLPGDASTPTPPTPAPSATLTDRYAKDKAGLAAAFGPTTAPDEDQVKETYRQNAQSAIDAINTKYATIEAQDRNTVDLMNREQRASNVLNGLSGAQMGGARTVDTATKGADLVKRTAAQKDSEVQAALSNAETRGTEEFDRQRTEFITNSKDKFAAEQAMASKIKDNAKAEITTLAGNMSYDDLATKNPALLKQYQSELGVDENGIKALFLSGSKGSLLSDTPQIVGNKAIWFSQKPDGTISKTEVEVPAGSSKIKDSRITDHGIQVLYEDGTYKVLGGGIGGGGTDDSSSFSNDDKQALSRAGLQNADQRTRSIYTDSPAGFKQEFSRNGFGNGSVTPDQILHSLSEWEAAQKKNEVQNPFATTGG